MVIVEGESTFWAIGVGSWGFGSLPSASVSLPVAPFQSQSIV